MPLVGSLLLTGTVDLIAGAVFTATGLLFWHKRTDEENRLAAHAFGLYWIGTGLYTMSDAVMALLAAGGGESFDVFLAFRYLTLPFLTVALASLLFYFLFLFTGERGWWIPCAALYAVILAIAVFYIHDRRPVDVLVTGWNTDLVYAEPYEAAFFQVMLLMLVLPPLAGSFAYGLLARQVSDRTKRARVLLVSVSIFLWTAGALVARLAKSSDLVQFLSRPAVGLVVASIILFAYRQEPLRRYHVWRMEAPMRRSARRQRYLELV